MALTSIQTNDSQRTLSEVSQARIRIVLHSLFVVLTFVAHKFDPKISIEWVVAVSVASIFSALSLYFWALRLNNTKAAESHRKAQRAACVISDNLFVTAVLALGGASTAGLWTIYLWTSIGYGVRYGIGYLHANVVVSTCAFTVMAVNSSFWKENPAFFSGMLIGMILVPTYTGFLIRQLHLAVREREEAYQAKSNFLARMSHELRTPLHAIISTAELLRGKFESSLQNNHVEVISISSNALLDLINRVLDIGKFESGDAGIARDHVNLFQLIADAIHIFHYQAKAKGIRVKIFADPQIPIHLIGSSSHINEVLLNMLGNAVKFTDHGEISLSVCVMTKTERVVDVGFEIADTGCGISEKDLSRIFEPFMQADQSKTRRHDGTGLGTSFSREILRLMGGEISIDSKLGKGTTVRFNVPFERPELRNPLHQIFDARVAVLGSLTALAELGSHVERFGVSVVGIETLEELADRLHYDSEIPSIDGVFVDAAMFGHNFASVSKIVYESPQTRLVPVIGFGDPGYRTTAIIGGFSSYLTSHSSEEEFCSALSFVRSLALKEKIDHSKDREPSLRSEHRAFRRLSVLVADDNATNRKIARIAIEDAGHLCTLVNNGDDALFALNDAQYDIAILDMHMPGRTGIEVAKIYRFAGFAMESPTPIVLLTADSTNEAREEAAAAGVCEFLTKPILPSHLVRAIEEVAGRFPTVEMGPGNSDVFGSLRSEMEHPYVVPVDSGRPKNALVDEKALSEIASMMTKAEQVQFFGEFFEDAAHYLEIVSATNSASGFVKAKDAMHALAGASLIIGATGLAAVARRVEALDSEAIVLKKSDHLSELKEMLMKTTDEISRRYL